MSLSVVRQQASSWAAAPRLAACLAVALAVAILVAACGGNDDPQPSGRIVLFGSPQVGLIPAAGGKMRFLRIGGAFNSAVFSPDQAQVAFNTDPRGIAIKTLESGQRILVPNQPSQDRFLSGDIAWARDGKRLAFVNGETIYTISVNGNDLRKLAQGSFPSWTKDGKHIVFVSAWNGNTAVGDIDVIGVDRTGLRSLGRGIYPVVSPNGDDVAYSTPAGVFVRPLSEGDPRLVVPNGFGPVWSPDGKFLAFIRYTACGEAACSGRVFTVPVKGGTPHAVGPTMGDPGPPSGWIR
jgi:Tol biopolymer transport system component